MATREWKVAKRLRDFEERISSRLKSLGACKRKAIRGGILTSDARSAV